MANLSLDRAIVLALIQYIVPSTRLDLAPVLMSFQLKLVRSTLHFIATRSSIQSLQRTQQSGSNARSAERPSRSLRRPLRNQSRLRPKRCAECRPTRVDAEDKIHYICVQC